MMRSACTAAKRDNGRGVQFPEWALRGRSVPLPYASEQVGYFVSDLTVVESGQPCHCELVAAIVRAGGDHGHHDHDGVAVQVFNPVDDPVLPVTDH